MESPAPLLDAARADEVQLVVRGRVIGTSPADKYAWARVRVISVLKNASGQTIGDELQVAYYSWTPALSEGEYTFYLEPYNDTPDHPWKLLGGSVERGVSHQG